MSKSDPLGLRPDDPLERWRADAERREQAFAPRRREREQQRAAEAVATSAAQLRQEVERRLAALEAAHADLRAALVVAMRATADGINGLADQRMDLSREQRNELRELKIEVARLGSMLAEVREQRVKGFQFAREREDEVTDLPKSLPGRAVN